MDEIEARIKRALERRRKLAGDLSTTAYRLIHREADGFPNLTVDQYGSILIGHILNRPKLEAEQEQAILRLAEVVEPESVYLKFREQGQLISFRGIPRSEAVICENQLKFLIRTNQGMSPGLFLDMRDVRKWVADHSKGKTILNTFAYTCAFGVAAVSGGAKRVLNVDLSKAYLEWGKRNMALNHLAADGHDFLYGDVFDWCRRFSKRNEKFDWVILDPPSYSTAKSSRFSAARHYDKLITAAAPLVAPPGRLIACCNTVGMSRRDFQAHLRQGLAGYSHKILAWMSEPAVDFPTIPGKEPYLKVAVIEIV